jgi:hypothetical protein
MKRPAHRRPVILTSRSSDKPVVVPTSIGAAAEFGVGALPLPRAGTMRSRMMRVSRPRSLGIMARIGRKHGERGSPAGEHRRIAVEAGSARVEPALNPRAISADATLDVETEPHTPGCGEVLARDRIVLAGTECETRESRGFDTGKVRSRPRVQKVHMRPRCEIPRPQPDAVSLSLAELRSVGRRRAVEACDHRLTVTASTVSRGLPVHAPER